MRHNAKVATFGRKTGPRRALLRGLVNSLVEHGRIKTTLAKAKELRRHVEPAITMAKKDTLHARRLLLSRYPNDKTVHLLMTDVGPRMAKRNGGYTRILKLGMRPGDRAEMAFIEFVDYTPKTGEATTAPVKKSAKGKKAAAATSEMSAEKLASKAKKKNARADALRKKNVRRISRAARAATAARA